MLFSAWSQPALGMLYVVTIACIAFDGLSCNDGDAALCTAD